jgi:hypothetical protein
MKKTLIITLLFAFCSAVNAQSKPDMFIYNKPLGFLTNNFEIGFDKKVSKQGFIGAMIGYGASEESEFTGRDMEELKLEFNIKTFLTKYTNKSAFYVQPYILFKQRKETVYDYFLPGGNAYGDWKSSAIDLGFVFAKRYNWNRLFMDIQLGGGILTPVSGEKEDRYNISNPIIPYSKGVHPRIGINLGINI